MKWMVEWGSSGADNLSSGGVLAVQIPIDYLCSVNMLNLGVLVDYRQWTVSKWCISSEHVLFTL